MWSRCLILREELQSKWATIKYNTHMTWISGLLKNRNQAINWMSIYALTSLPHFPPAKWKAVVQVHASVCKNLETVPHSNVSGFHRLSEQKAEVLCHSWVKHMLVCNVMYWLIADHPGNKTQSQSFTDSYQTEQKHFTHQIVPWKIMKLMESKFHFELVKWFIDWTE